LFLKILPLQEPAVRMHWLSALSAAAAAVLLGLGVVEISDSRAAGQDPASTAPALPTVLSGAVTALILAFSPLLWSQATVAEVHGLNVAFVAAVILLLLRYRSRGATWQALAAVFLYGLGLGNHLTGLLLLPLVGGWLLVYGWAGHLKGRRWLLVAAAFALGLAVYIYLPLAAAGEPPINWGDPQTWDRFWWLVSGQLYRRAMFGVEIGQIPARLSAWGHLLLGQFGWWGWVLVLVGLWSLSRTDRPVLRSTLFVFAAYSIYALTYDRADSHLYLLPAIVAVAIWLGLGLVALLSAAWALGRDPAIAPGLRAGLRIIAVLVVALLSLMQPLGNFRDQDLRADREATEFITSALASAEPGALIITGGDRTTFALWYHRYAVAGREDIAIVSSSLWGFDWYNRTLSIHHPEVAAFNEEGRSKDLQELVGASLSRRPVYVTGDAREAVAGYALEPADPLYRLRPPEG
jgi:hypothetical protein